MMRFLSCFLKILVIVNNEKWPPAHILFWNWNLIFLLFFHWSTEKLVGLMGRKPHSIPSYTTHHGCDLLSFAYLFANTHALWGIFTNEILIERTPITTILIR